MTTTGVGVATGVGGATTTGALAIFLKSVKGKRQKRRVFRRRYRRKGSRKAGEGSVRSDERFLGRQDFSKNFLERVAVVVENGLVELAVLDLSVSELRRRWVSKTRREEEE